MQLGALGHQGAVRQSRRLRMLDSDVRKYVITASCQRCEYLRQGRTLLARGVRHNEECRDHTHEAMRQDGVEKVKRLILKVRPELLLEPSGKLMTPPALRPMSPMPLVSR